jgi:hypothetical protein
MRACAALGARGAAAPRVAVLAVRRCTLRPSAPRPRRACPGGRAASPRLSAAAADGGDAPASAASVAEAAAPSVALVPRATVALDKPLPLPPAPAPLPPGSAETALLLLSLCYLHASACGYALPALLPDVAADLALSDPQAASLTFAFTLTYSLLLIPAGAAADVIDRPKLLAAGATAGGAHPDG